MATHAFVLVSETAPSITGSRDDKGRIALSTGEYFESFELFREFLKTKRPKYMVEELGDN